MKYRILLVALVVMGLGISLAYAQDPGIRDTLFVERVDTALASSSFSMQIRGYHDENIQLQWVPLKFAPTGADIVCDSVVFGPDISAVEDFKVTNCDGPDTCIINNAEKVLNIWWIAFGSPLAAGEHLIATAYFTTGPTWTEGAVVDTITYGVNGHLNFTDENTAEIVPYYETKGQLDVRDVRNPNVPIEYSLLQNYPNPFNAETVIRFALKKPSDVSVEVYNILGQRVKSLINNEKMTAGVKEITWNGRDDKGNDVASGIYFYRLKTAEFTDIKKMVLLK